MRKKDHILNKKQQKKARKAKKLAQRLRQLLKSEDSIKGVYVLKGLSNEDKQKKKRSRKDSDQD
jgi:RNA polymerase-interacting CarD/CdnL/TRCF family regulator